MTGVQTCALPISLPISLRGLDDDVGTECGGVRDPDEIFRILGMTKKNLFTLILKEAFLISLIGTTVGFFVGGISLVALIPKIVSSLKIPFLIPSFKEYALIFLLNSGLCIFSGPLACLFSSVKNFKKDIYVSLRENE